ncbi:lysine decarboxylase [Pullulanibacillus camelliae]|uniref:Lysine decarboxylase n=1 Tax=Pullulanibacillus camelliae TaxID=1707096 RepID=A0A8J2YMT6_9BACL|nr:aminotransferase class I/II-fold pyridoxal phosphate-dependent enzyme [Pullulanibacillus camelliae]GGE53825.1 lysine decarboxylase [Pullulanibacillus camelliae]
MDQKQTPLFDALCKYQKEQYYSFHVPGHKDGEIFWKTGRQPFQELLKIDATEIAGLDDLYHPTGPIADALRLLSDLYGTKQSYFLVNGSTVGNLVMVKAVCRPGDQVIVQRNSHKSIFNALRLARVSPIFISPDIDYETGMAVSPSSEALMKAIDKYPGTKALILTYPNYYGVTADIEEAITYARRKGIKVLVDEAHGSHFLLGSPFPKSTLAMGADIVVHSAHKTLPAMTMGSYLHVNSTRVSIEKIEDVLGMLQSSSPSYPIMASLDLARAYLASIHEEKVTSILETIYQFKKGLGRLSTIELAKQDERYTYDLLKVVIKSSGNQTGFQLKEHLHTMGIYPEMADPQHVLFTLGLDDESDYAAILHHLENGQEKWRVEQSEDSAGTGSRWALDEGAQTDRPLDVSYDVLEGLPLKEVPLSKAAGCIAAQMVIPYPPGIPITIAGERITEDQIKSIINWRNAGASFQGMDVSKTRLTMKVYNE